MRALRDDKKVKPELASLNRHRVGYLAFAGFLRGVASQKDVARIPHHYAVFSACQRIDKILLRNELDIWGNLGDHLFDCLEVRGGDIAGVAPGIGNKR